MAKARGSSSLVELRLGAPAPLKKKTGVRKIPQPTCSHVTIKIDAAAGALAHPLAPVATCSPAPQALRSILFLHLW